MSENFPHGPFGLYLVRSKEGVGATDVLVGRNIDEAIHVSGFCDKKDDLELLEYHPLDTIILDEFVIAKSNLSLDEVLQKLNDFISFWRPESDGVATILDWIAFNVYRIGYRRCLGVYGIEEASNEYCK